MDYTAVRDSALLLKNFHHRTPRFPAVHRHRTFQLPRELELGGKHHGLIFVAPLVKRMVEPDLPHRRGRNFPEKPFEFFEPRV